MKSKPIIPATDHGWLDYKLYRPVNWTCPCTDKCCSWQGSHLERQFESEIRSRLHLFGSLRWGRYKTLVVGWAVAKGQDPDEASKFATHIQFH